MIAFRYRAARQDGAAVTGTVSAASATAAADLVTARGLFPIEIRPHEARVRPARVGELATMLGGLAALLEAGLPADRALASLEADAPPALRDALAAAGARVREGAGVSHALEQTGVVPAAVVGLLRAGERSGRFAQAVHRAAEDLERDAEARAQVRAALTYPGFLAAAGTLSLVAIAGFVVPRFASLLDAHGTALPAATRLLLTASDLVARYGAATLAVLAVTGVAVGRWARSEHGALALHRRLLELPFVGALRLRFATARACGALAGLLESGVPILAALDFAGRASGDRALRERLAAASDDVNRGERIAAALRRHRALSPLALQLALFGDRAGRLAAFLAHASRIEERTARRALQRAVALLEPLLILGFGAVVAFVAAALLQAVYSVRPGGVR
jgi:type II secretory pathway component PulF